MICTSKDPASENGGRQGLEKARFRVLRVQFQFCMIARVLEMGGGAGRTTTELQTGEQFRW